jgi:hypothetical protein
MSDGMSEGLSRTINVRTRAAYDAAFQAERMVEYPVMDQLEARFGYAVDRQRLEDAARVLACPLKKNPPNWQHGRLVYALGRHYLARERGKQTWLDIGTAKGFSACAMSWAMQDEGFPGDIHSFDIIGPYSREPRNSVEDGKTIYEFTEPYRARDVFLAFGATATMASFPFGSRINFAFIDGSHTYDGVKTDIEFVSARQQPGDIILFDDMQVPGVRKAVHEPWAKLYEIEEITLLPLRKYALAIRQ